MPPDLARRALHWALKREGDPYVWGGQSPGSFDCSGLILWAYEQSLGRLRLPDGQGGYVADATMDHLWRYASRPVRLDQVRPGDLVFITSEGGQITHGGLVIAVSKTEVTFVNASSFHDEVVVDTWPLNSTTRGQWVVGFGQLLALPGRRPPMPPVGAGTRLVHLDGSVWSSLPATHLLAGVSKDELQSELVVVQPFSRFAVGVGVRLWRDGWREHHYIAGGTEPFALVGITIPVGPLRIHGAATHAASGWSSLGQATLNGKVRGAEIVVTAGYRRWAADPWYSGPTVSVSLTF